MLTLLFFVCFTQTLLLTVIFYWAKTSRRIEFSITRVKLMTWNIFSSLSNVYFIPRCCPTLGYFIWNKDKKDKIKALQPVYEVVYSWLNFRVVATIKYGIYHN